MKIFPKFLSFAPKYAESFDTLYINIGVGRWFLLGGHQARPKLGKKPL